MPIRFAGPSRRKRTWWDVTFYDLRVKINPQDSTIEGCHHITYQVLKPRRKMQIDLMTPLEIDSIIQNGKLLHFLRGGNAFFVQMTGLRKKDTYETISVYYRGKPAISKNPPWSGGFIWKRDSLGNPFISTACQTVTSEQIWSYMNKASGVDFSNVFRQYPTTTEIPVLEYKIDNKTLFYRWTHVIKGFNMPLRVMLSPDRYSLIQPEAKWKKVVLDLPDLSDFKVDENFYILSKKIPQ